MIISASRREDIPAWRMDWFMERLAEGFVEVANPFDPRRKRRVSLLPGEVDCILFWTRNLRPLVERSGELADRGFGFLVQATLTGYPAALEPGVPRREEAIEAFIEFAQRVAPGRAAWRYDPLILAPSGLDAAFHRENFAYIAGRLAGATDRLVISAVDEYRSTASRLARAGIGATSWGSPLPSRDGAGRRHSPPPPDSSLAELLGELAEIGRGFGFIPRTCAEPSLAAAAGIAEGACVDRQWIAAAFPGRPGAVADLDLFGAPPAAPRPPRAQRPGCRCAPSVDIGEYGRCRAGCAYCYARR